MKLKALLSALLIVALLCPAALMEEALNEPLPALEEAAVPDSAEDGEEPEQPEDSVPADSEEKVLVAEPVDETVEEVDFEEDYAYFEAQTDDSGVFPDNYVESSFKTMEASEMYAANEDIEINEFIFPDMNFREYVRKNYDKDGNGFLSIEERQEVKEIRLGGYWGNRNISDVTGISQFSELNYLDCTYNQLTSLHLNGCKNLVTVDCSYNYLNELDVSECASLKYLSCCDNNLTKLDVRRCTNLLNLDCYGNNLSTLDVSGCKALRSLWFRDNNVTTIDISGCPELEVLNCGNNPLTTIDIRECPNLLRIFKGNHLTKVTEEGFVVDSITEVDVEDDAYWEIQFYHDANLEIITGMLVAPQQIDIITLTPVPVTNSTPTIAAAKKSNKTTITAAPGSIYQLDLGGVGGKAFKSSRKKVAVVDGTGQVTIRGAGKTKITFKVGKKKRTLTLTVKDPTIPTSVSLNPVNTAVKVGESVTLTPVISPETNSTFKWKSSNKKVASVSNGVVTFKKAGKVTITCTAMRGKKKAKVTFIVNK